MSDASERAAPATGVALEVVAELIERLKADDLLYNRGPDYEPLRIKPSAVRLEAASALVSSAAEIAELRRELDVSRENGNAQGEIYWQQHVADHAAYVADVETREQALEAANKKIATMKRQIDNQAATIFQYQQQEAAKDHVQQALDILRGVKPA